MRHHPRRSAPTRWPWHLHVWPPCRVGGHRILPTGGHQGLPTDGHSTAASDRQPDVRECGIPALLGPADAPRSSVPRALLGGRRAFCARCRPASCASWSSRPRSLQWLARRPLLGGRPFFLMTARLKSGRGLPMDEDGSDGDPRRSFWNPSLAMAASFTAPCSSRCGEMLKRRT